MEVTKHIDRVIARLNAAAADCGKPGSRAPDALIVASARGPE